MHESIVTEVDTDMAEWPAGGVKKYQVSGVTRSYRHAQQDRRHLLGVAR
jgi:hypothetical protein